jgi:hypothetical protein
MLFAARCISLLLALFGPSAMSDLSPKCASKRTSAGPCYGPSERRLIGSLSNPSNNDPKHGRGARGLGW